MVVETHRKQRMVKRTVLRTPAMASAARRHKTSERRCKRDVFLWRSGRSSVPSSCVCRKSHSRRSDHSLLLLLLLRLLLLLLLLLLLRLWHRWHVARLAAAGAAAAEADAVSAKQDESGGDECR